MAEPDERARDRFITRRGAALDATPWFDRGRELQAHLARLHARLRALPEVEERGDARRWHLFAARDPDAWFGGPTTIAFADRDRRDPAALDALAEAWRRPGLHHGEDLWLEVDPRDEALLAVLMLSGLRVDSVITAGSVAEAFAAIGPPGAEPEDGGARLEPLEAADIADVVELHRRTFSDNPEWCWFGAAPAHLARLGETLEAWTGAAAPSDAHWVFRGPDGRALGHVDVSIGDEPGWGRAAGIGIVLAPGLRGRGLLRVAWRRCLVVAREGGARVWKGGSSQPAVLSLGARLGRRWHQIGLRAGVDDGRSEALLRLRPR